MTLLIFLIVLSILIFVHELGHFLAAKWSGVKVEEFGFGFPPRVWGKKVGETLYSVNALPIGGFVKLYGEDEDVAKDNHRAFFAKSKIRRTLIITAGVLMNFLLAVVIFSGLFFVQGIPQPPKVQIVEVVQESPAESSGIKAGDIVLSVGGQDVDSIEGFVDKINNNKGEETQITLLRGGQEVTVSAVPRQDPPEGEGALGVALAPKVAFVKPPWPQRPFIALASGFNQTVFWVKTTVTAIVDTIAKAIAGQPPKDLAGPVGIYQITAGVSRIGFAALATFVAILSVNLAVLNIIPFPALDGGRLLFIGIEAIFGRRVLPTFERWAHMVGMIILLLLILLITINDINRLISGGFNFL